MSTDCPNSHRFSPAVRNDVTSGALSASLLPAPTRRLVEADSDMRFSRKISFLLPIVLLSAASAAAAEPVLGLDEAVEIALRHNRHLGMADADVDRAAATLEEARSGRLPRADLEAAFSSTTDPTVVFSQKLRQETFTQADFAVDQLNEPDPLENLGGSLSVYQPIYTGGRLSGTVEAASAMHDAAVSGRERTRQEVVERVIEAYTGAVLAASQLEVARDASETARANTKLVADLRAGGLAVESDLLQARVRETEVQELVVRAESAVEVSRAALNLVLGRDLDTPFSLPDALDAPDSPPRPLEGLVAAALQQRPDLQSSSDRLRAAETNARAARSGYRPEVGLAGSAAANSDEISGAYGANWSVFMTARFTLFDGHRTRAQVRQATERHSRARLEHDLLEQSVSLEVRQAYHDLRAALERVQQATAAVAMAEESMRIVQDRYSVGLTTLVELLDSESVMTRARTREIAARRDVLLGRARLDLSVGRL
jgi:outer membrane protein TolC